METSQRKTELPLKLCAFAVLLVAMPVIGFEVTPERCKWWGFNYVVVPATWGMATICVPSFHFLICSIIFSFSWGARLRFGYKLVIATASAIVLCGVAARLGVAFILASNPLNLRGNE